MNRIVPVVLLAVGLSACDLVKTTPTDPTNPDPVTTTAVYSAVGASDAIGYGSSVSCFPFATLDQCPNGTGYVQTIARRLKAGGRTVNLLNLGIPGSVLSAEIQAIGRSVGKDILTNFIDAQMPFVLTDSTFVTVFAGGNDVNTIATAVQAGLGGSDPNGYIAQRRQAFGRDLHQLLSGIKNRAPSARVVWLNLPNLAALPYAAGYTSAQRKTVQQIAVGFSAEINGLRSDGALIVDAMCDTSFYQGGVYSEDGFHPNDTGYAHMADIMYGPITTGQAPAPPSACAQMTMF